MITKSQKGLIKPPKINKGDKLAAISLSFGAACLFPERFNVGCQQIEREFEVQVIPTKNALRDPQWLSRNPQARADDLIEALEDNSIKGIVCSIGGEDSIRVNKYIDLGTIKCNPKVFIGYSDATSTHMRFLQAGVISFYGPTVMAGFGENGGLPNYLRDSVERALFNTNPIGNIGPNLEGWTTEFLDWSVPSNQAIKRKLAPPIGPITLQGTGIAKGHLIGGCIEVLEMQRGTEYWPAAWFDGAILFLEIAEKEFLPIQFARTIRSYGIMGILNGLSGIIMGRPGGGMPVESFKNYNDILVKIVSEEFGLPNLPIIVNMDFGHTDPIFTIPYGLEAELDCMTGILNILESAVS